MNPPTKKIIKKKQRKPICKKQQGRAESKEFMVECVLRHGWRRETSCRKAPDSVVPGSLNCWWDLRAASLTAKRGRKTFLSIYKIFDTVPFCCSKYQQIDIHSWWFTCLDLRSANALPPLCLHFCITNAEPAYVAPPGYFYPSVKAWNMTQAALNEVHLRHLINLEWRDWYERSIWYTSVAAQWWPASQTPLKLKGKSKTTKGYNVRCSLLIMLPLKKEFTALSNLSHVWRTHENIFKILRYGLGQCPASTNRLD